MRCKHAIGTIRIPATVSLLAAMVLAIGCGTEPNQPGDQNVTTSDAKATEPGHSEANDANEVDISAEEAQAIAKEAYVWGFPMVMGYKTMYAYVIDRENKDYKGPFNQMSCEARVFTPQDKAVVTPNSDTPYCMFWIDLRAEPMVLSVPEMEPERFYHFQLIDLYTHNFAYVGTLTTGNGAGKYLIAGPAWDGEKPEGINAVLRSETPFVFNVTRTQLFGPDDLPKVKEIQGGYGLQPLSAFLGEDPPAAAPTPDFPKWDEGSQFDERFFAYLDLMMSLLEKPGDGEKPLWDQLARLGIGPGNNFDFAALSPEIQDSLKAGVKAGFGEIEKFIAEHSSDPLMSGKLFGTRAFLEESARTNFDLEDLSMLRSAAAHIGLYGNSAAEAIYPTYLVDADKEPLDASKHGYTVTFEQGKLPPAKSFWSLTMYDAQTQLFIENPLERYLLNSTMMEQFKLAEDGSLVFYVSNESPGPDFESNWLPAPDGPFYLVMRLYGPEKEALEGEWTPPPLQKAEASPAEDSASSATPTPELGDVDIDDLVRRSYQYVAMYNVNNKFALKQGGWNTVDADTQLKDHTMREIARPNNDTLYISSLIDLRKDPVILEMPAFDSDYVSLMVTGYDHYVNVPMATRLGDFKKPEKMLFYTERTEGYDGKPVDGVDRVFECTGDFISAVLRIMPHAKDQERFQRIVGQMKQVKIITLSEFQGGKAKPIDDVEFPAVGKRDADIFGNSLLEVMQFVFNHTTFDPQDKLDRALLAAYEPLGVVPGQAYDPDKVAKIDGAQFRKVSERIFAEEMAKTTDEEFSKTELFGKFKPKGQMPLELLVFQSVIGPIGLPATEAVYPGVATTEGKPLNAMNDYVIRMSADELPPTEVFWSLTLYDLNNGFFIPNDQKKYSVGENAGMKLNDEGGIEVYVAAEKPEGVPEENWLPINRKDEDMDIVLRVYVADLEKMKTWSAPKAEKLAAGGN